MAAAARGVILPHFRAPMDVETKADATPVTIADRETEAALRKMIAGKFPDHGIVGEEEGADRADASYVWVLDPIDGTRRFITGNPLFGTLIALLRDGRPILGVIDMPVLGERWIGAAGRPSLFSDRRGSREARVRDCAALGDAKLYATSPHMFLGDDFPAFERVRQASGTVLYGGECYAYGLLASGFVDLVIEADMGIYDYLAHVPIIAGAGGIMSDWQGAPLGLASGGQVIAAGDARCHARAMALLREP
jgi:histidinol phosphatase-like enzyme (inositol monophosphatase family)